MENHNKHNALNKTKATTATFFTCPMHPEIKQDKPGMCPECGMALVKFEIRKSKSETLNINILSVFKIIYYRLAFVNPMKLVLIFYLRPVNFQWLDRAGIAFGNLQNIFIHFGQFAVSGIVMIDRSP